MFNFMRNYQTDLQKNHTMLCSYPQCRSLPIDPHPHQHWVLSIFWIPAIAMDVKWSLVEILICISLMTILNICLCIYAFIGQSFIFFCEVSVEVFCSFVIGFFIFLSQICRHLSIFWVRVLHHLFVYCEYFLLTLGLPFHFLRFCF